MVKYTLIKHEQVRQFLDSLGLTMPDIADLVLKKILPRYINSKELSIKTWQRDFRKILQAFQTDSHAKRNRLKDACKEAYILLAVSVNGNENLDLVKPHQVYLNTSEMREFFSGCAQISFLAPNTTYQEDDLKVLQELGVASSPRTTKAANYQGFVILADSRPGAHKRGLDGFDPSWTMEGLEHALDNPNLERSRLLWHYLLPHAQCVRGVIEHSTRQTYEKVKREEKVSNTGQHLIGVAWLPDRQGKFHKPKELELDDLPSNFDTFSPHGRTLADKLGMRKSEEQQALATLVKGDERKKKLLESLFIGRYF